MQNQLRFTVQFRDIEFSRSSVSLNSRKFGRNGQQDKSNEISSVQVLPGLRQATFAMEKALE